MGLFVVCLLIFWNLKAAFNFKFYVGKLSLTVTVILCADFHCRITIK